MTSSDIVRHRLFNQQIAATTFTQPHEIVSWFGAMQAQEYAMSKWAIGLRLNGSTDADVEQAFNDGMILRTHCVRPTWHFVTREDIRMVLTVTAPRINAANAYMYRKLELDNKTFNRSNDFIVKTLEGGKYLTREMLQTVLSQKKISADGFRLSYLMMRAELDGIICSGARQGKQFTYALLDERVPDTKTVDRIEALAELTERYFTSRGPATVQDFAYWSGLTLKEANEGVASLSSRFSRAVIDGKEYLFPQTLPKKTKNKNIQTTFLMPDYDEYGMSYKDRSAIFNPDNNPAKLRGDNPLYNRMIIIDGQIAGTWKCTIQNNTVAVETAPFSPLSATKRRVVMDAVRRFTLFFGTKEEKSI